MRAKYFSGVNAITEADIISMATSALRSAPESLLFDSVDRNGNDVLLSAKKEGYEGDSTGEAEEWLRAKAKGLDMSHEARMARAIDLGYIANLDDLIMRGNGNERLEANDNQRQLGSNVSRVLPEGEAVTGSVGKRNNTGGIGESKGRPKSPRRLFHLSNSDITEFKLKHPERKDEGWLGTGIYVASLADAANGYMWNKGRYDGANVIPLFINVSNPYQVSSEERVF